VPGNGSVVITQDYVDGGTKDDIAAKAAAARDKLGTPTIAISSPPDGSTSGTPGITVSGTSSDPGGAVTGVTVNGTAATLAADGSWKPLGMDHEVIHVRGRADVQLDLRSTTHGPLLDPIFTNDRRAIALHWTLYDNTLNTIPLYEINTAVNWPEFSAALAQWCWPTQNVVYADDQGHIAYHAVGRIPLRPAGLAGVPIQDGAHEWQGYIPFDVMPSAVDPPSGFLATANSRVTTSTSPYPLSLDWADPYRAERITKPAHTIVTVSERIFWLGRSAHCFWHGRSCGYGRAVASERSNFAEHSRKLLRRSRGTLRHADGSTEVTESQ